MKSKKLFVISFFAFLLMGSTVNAQLRFGIKGDVGVNKLSANYKEMFSTENMNGFKVGPAVEFMLPVANLGVEAAILYSNEKMHIKDFNSNNLLDGITNHYLDVPVNLKYKAGLISPVKVFIAAGPYVNFRLAGNEFSYNKIKDLVETKTFQAGVNVGLGAEILSSVQVGINYKIKLTDNYSVSQPDLKDAFNSKDGLWSVTAAFFF